ncbi:MAG: toll/interleukin-1 receptor domain-containing protein, partial [Gammaproteobacteria bacterium]|nr:toll/interleukin-1 receptor domain-containing protein [Gammaproteobacteria bacterium]
MSTPEFHYRAFLSYSHQDRGWANWLHKALETYRVPGRLVGTRTAAGTI